MIQNSLDERNPITKRCVGGCFLCERFRKKFANVLSITRLEEPTKNIVKAIVKVFIFLLYVGKDYRTKVL